VKKILSLLAALILACMIPVSAFATSGYEAQMTSALRTIALNSPGYFGHNQLWSIVQETPLYDVNDNLTAYCFDMVAQDIDNTTSYVIVSVGDTQFPILLFGYEGISAFLGREFERAYYFGTLDFFLEESGVYESARTGVKLSDNQIHEVFAPLNVDLSEQSANYSAIRQRYLTNIQPTSAPDTGRVSGVSLQWRKGCAPTTIAMLINAHYLPLSATTLIDSLASRMGTDSSGATEFAKITSGTLAYFIANPNLSAPSTCGWNSTKSDGSPRTGSLYNSKVDFKASIKAGFPVGVYLSSSNVTTKGYPNGIGAHMMSGIGYSFGSSGDFITCYTTNVADGAVSFPLTNSGLKNHAWFMLKWK